MGCKYVSGDTKAAKERVMKNTIKFLGIIAFVAVIGFSMATCGGGGGKLSGTYEMDEYPGITRTFSGNKYIFESSGGKSEGTFTVSGDELTITQDGDVTVFKFKIDGKKLQLANVKAKLDDPRQWQNLTKK
jgi:hypothetical protein